MAKPQKLVPGNSSAVRAAEARLKTDSTDLALILNELAVRREMAPLPHEMTQDQLEDEAASILRDPGTWAYWRQENNNAALRFQRKYPPSHGKIVSPPSEPTIKELEIELKKLRDLRSQMVGSLYPQILDGQIETVTQKIMDLRYG